MLHILPNYQQNNSVNFKAYIKTSPYLKDALKNSIDNNICRQFLHKNLKKLAHDGTERVIEINYAKGKLQQWLMPGAFQVTVDGKKLNSNYHFGGGGISVQCARAIDSITPGVQEYKNNKTRLGKIRKKLEEVRSMFFLYDGAGLSPEKTEKYLDKKYQFYKKLYSKTIKEELVNIQNSLTAKGIWGFGKE